MKPPFNARRWSVGRLRWPPAPSRAGSVGRRLRWRAARWPPAPPAPAPAPAAARSAGGVVGAAGIGGRCRQGRRDRALACVGRLHQPLRQLGCRVDPGFRLLRHRLHRELARTSGTVSFSSRASGTGALRCAYIFAASWSRGYGTLPVSTWKRTQPRAYTSARASPAALDDPLRRQVVERPDDRAGLRERRGRGHVARDPEVREVRVLAPVLAVDQHVRRLHVAVHQVAPVRRRQGRRHLRQEPGRACRLERSVGFEQRLQVGSLDVAHA